MLFDKLYPKQRWAAKRCIKLKTSALFYEQGTGKTWITGGVIERLAASNDEFQALVVCQLSNLRSSWVSVLERVDGITLHTDYSKFLKDEGPRVLLIHYEAMRKYRRELCKFGWDLVVFDESQRLKSRNGQQSRIAGRLSAEYRMILTGTPFDDVLENPEELWAQLRFVTPHVFGSRWGDFADQYLRRSGWMGKKFKFRSSMLKPFLRRIRPYILRARKAEVVDVPDLRYRFVGVTMLPEQRRAYEQMAKNSVTRVRGKDVTADLAITQLVHLQRICGGFVRDDDDEVHRLGSTKLRALLRIVERHGYPVVVFCKYLHEVADVEQALSGDDVTVSTIIGKTRSTRDETINRFQKGHIDVLISQVRTGGVGLDLQRAHVGIFYSTTFSFIDFEQAASRLHRSGQKNDVTIYLIYCKDTVDKQIFDTVLSKRSVSESILSEFNMNRPGGHTMAKKATSQKASPKAKGKKKDKDEAAPAAAAQAGSKYGITDLAEVLGIAPASVRVKLRANGVEKVGGRYGWDTKAELNEVADAIRSSIKATADAE